MKSISTDNWVKKLLTLMECYSARQKDKILHYLTTWLELKVPVLWKISHEDKDDLLL